MRTAPPVAFLGMCERAAPVRDPFTNILRWNAIGLRSAITSLIYPMPLKGWHMVFAFYDAQRGESFDLVLRNSHGDEALSMKVGVEPPAEASAELDSPGQRVLDRLEDDRTLVPSVLGSWALSFASVTALNFWIMKPDTYTFYLRTNGAETSIGYLWFGLLHPAPLTESRIAAIRSNPRGTKSVRAEFSCGVCSGQLKIYKSLDPSPQLVAEGYVVPETLPDSFRCKCGSFFLDLSIVRENFHGLLGQPIRRDGDPSFVPLYEASALHRIAAQLTALVDQDVREEELQQFINTNPVVLHTLAAADRIFVKPSILTRYVADYAILTPKKQLLLVEIERASTRLLKQDGHIASPLQHAMDQVHDWLRVANEHRAAILDSLELKPSDVAAVRGVVVAGRDGSCSADNLRHLKARDLGPIAFVTYDDVVAGVHNFAAEIAQL